MKMNFKPLAIAAAVTAVTAGYAGTANAQGPSGDPIRAIGQLGDVAVVPYYTVQDNWITGVHITNTSDRTQVVKLRLRRATDSADALDFNLIMSPKDVWTGYLENTSGKVVFNTDDKTCTAPIRADGKFEMPFIYATGAEEGYIEVIGMGSPITEKQPIALAALHNALGVPANCTAVASNFFAGGSSVAKGIIDHNESTQAGACPGTPAPALCSNTYNDGGNALKVSYFFRDADSGTEMGNNAVHIADASDNAWMSNQEFGLFSGDVTGFDYPDLNGGPLLSGDRGLFNQLRASAVLGVSQMQNDWSVNTANGVSTDWVVTMPGQYTMLDYTVWAQNGFNPANCGKLDNPTTAIDDGVPQCDFRDIPVEASLTLYDREEGEITPADGDLVISPAPPGVENKLIFPYEVNVVEWTDGSTVPVLGSSYATSVDASPLGAYGWASLSLSSGKKVATQNNTPSPDANSNGQAVCEATPFKAPYLATPSNNQRDNTCVPATGSVPVVGFVAWQRKLPSNPDASYGRLVEHSFTAGSAM